MGSEMKRILEFLYDNRKYVYQQTKIIEALYGEIPNSKKALVSRSVKLLMKAGLVDSRKAYYSEQFSCWIKQRVHYFITPKGEKYVESLRDSSWIIKKRGFASESGDVTRLFRRHSS